jgi:signal transduction histidine kinase
MKGSALALTADITAIVVRDDQGESFRLAGVYDRAADRELIGVPIPASDQPFLGEVWETQQLTLLTPEKDASHLQSLYLAMGVEELGPLLIQPIVYGGGTLGLLLAGNPYSLHSFTTTEREIATALGQQLAASVVGAREYEQVVVQWTQANERLREVESTAAERQVALEGEVQEARQIAQRLLAQLRALESTRNRSREPSRLGTEPVASAPATAGAEDRAVAWKEMAERGAILASITQELRSPLTAITGYTDLLLGETVGILGALQRKFLQRIRTNLERMAILLDDAVRLTVGPGAGYQPGAQTVQVRNVVEEVLSRQSIQFREKSLTLDLDVAENLPEIQADRDALAQIVNYLISNACQASPTGGRIRVALFYLAGGGASDPDKQQTDYIQLSVTDSGAGIAPEDQARVFGRLYRTDHPHIPGLGDTGIGLSIAKVLVDAHGGQISIDSHPGSGATFQVLLPLQSTFGQTMAQTLQEQKQPAPVDEFKNGSRT